LAANIYEASNMIISCLYIGF